MDTEYAIYFLLFVLANSYFMYRAGQREGRFEGMVQITRFFKSENALIDKSDINRFKNWPIAIQVFFVAPYINIYLDKKN